MSFGKLVVLAIIIVVVWNVFRYARRMEAVSRALKREIDLRRQRAAATTTPRSIAAEDLAKCARCGAYVAKGAACGRPDCPARG
jgi:hypothetical protein